MRNRQVVGLGDLNIAMSHLIAKNVGGNIVVGKIGPISVPQVMELEQNAQLLLDRAGVVFHRIDRLNGAIIKAVDKIEGRYHGTVDILQHCLILFPLFQLKR